jgi:replicative DNA helicase Mcm
VNQVLKEILKAMQQSQWITKRFDTILSSSSSSPITTTNNNNHFEVIPSSTLSSLYELGFKLVPLYENHVPAIAWRDIYDSPDHWQVEKFRDPIVYSKFKNIASTVGKTHIKDPENKELFIQVLDVDSENAYNIITTPIAQLNNNPSIKPKIHSAIIESLEITESEIANTTMLDVLKKYTFVTKTRKSYGFHIWWLSHNQNKPILTADCKKGSDFEIKTDKKNGLCTLPPSTHRDDKDFRYSLVGRVDKLLINDALYRLFIELFSECLRNKVQDDEIVNENIENKLDKGKEKLQQAKNNTVFHTLSSQAIQNSINYLSPYYLEGDRNSFVFAFSGTAFHCCLSEESASSIIEGLCDRTNDNEKKGRLVTLQSTFKNGNEGKSITGAPSLADLLIRIKGCDSDLANSIINTLKKLWHKDIFDKGKQDSENNNSPKELSVSQAKREKDGYVKVKGTIIGLTSVYNLIKSVTLTCDSCGLAYAKKFPIPLFKLPFKEKCPGCSESKLTADPQYVSVVDIELQDIDIVNDIERLPVRVFEKDTYDIVGGETVRVIGDIHIIRKNDNIKNKLEVFLFAKSIEYTKRKELVLTEDDKKKIQEWKKQQENQNKNSIDELALLFAPELIDLDHVKKGMLLVCASAGLRNVDGRLPKRLRLNALLIGDPGLAKTSILEKTTNLVPNSQYAGGQSSTGLSLTSHVSKEDGGIYTLRFGPVVLAKDSLCAINEIGQLPLDQHKHLLDCMEENGFPIAKYGYSTFIEAHPSIIASANPINNRWQNSQIVNFSEFPTLSQIIQRFDLIFVFRENTDEAYLLRFTKQRKIVAENYKKGVYEGNEEFIIKYLLYSRGFKPELTEEAHSLLEQFYIRMGKSGVSGLPRKLDSLMRLTIATAKLKLKSIADAQDAQEVISFYNDILKNFNQAVFISKNPRDLSFDLIRQIIKEHNGSPMLLTDAARTACDRDPNIKYHLLGKKENHSIDSNNNIDALKLNQNHHLKEILTLLRKDDLIQITQEKPMAMRWKTEIEGQRGNINLSISNYQYNQENQKIAEVDKPASCTRSQGCDECDECDDNKSQEEEEQKIKDK